MTTATSAPSPPCKRPRWPILLLPYIVGIAWTCVHPILSVITGETKCRGWFIDESSLELGSLRLDAKYFPVTSRDKRQEYSTLCESLFNNGGLRDNVECIQHEEGFQVSKIVPISNAVEPAETVAIVVSAPSDTWATSDFHNAILQLISRLSDPASCPWLAKNILVVSSTCNDVTMHSTVSLFLDSYLGSTQISPLATQFSFGILRNVLVVDINVNETDASFANEIRILPHGRKGVLPNMDLVFGTMSMYSRSSFLRSNTNMVMHSYGKLSRTWKDQIPSSLSPFAQQWAFELASMFLFAYQLAMGPHPPHFKALEKGIDALTIEVDLFGRQANANAVECVQKLEGVVRSLSNLHERLHHSITQYLLPSPTKFVSHAEYLIPNLLILLPLAIRAVTLVLFDIQRFDFGTLQVVLVVGCTCLILSLIAFRTRSESVMNALYVILFVYMCFGTPVRKDQQPVAYGQSLQFLTCLVAIYMHVPLVMAHVSLAFPSILVWSSLIAFPSFPVTKTLWQRVKRPMVLVSAILSLLLVPNQIFAGNFTPYVTTVFMPLSMLLSLLWLI